MNEHIEKLKREYTDKYVAVDGSRPELARFQNIVGQVKTVNMSGRALVEFMDYHLNVGWYDIDVDYLKVVDKPQLKASEAAKKPAAKPSPKAAAAASEKKLSPLELARAMDAKKKAQAAPTTAPTPGGAKMSTADVLAAARGTTAAPQSDAKSGIAPGNAKVAADPKRMSTADVLAAARGAQAAAPAKAEQAPPPAATSPVAPAAAEKPSGARSKLSTSDILAMARGEKAAAVPLAEELTSANRPDVTPEVIATPVASVAAAAEPPAKPAASERVDRSTMTVDEMIAWCRAHDG